MGEWGRWNDVTVIQEADGTSRTKLTTYKRVQHQRRIVATRAAGLLVDPVDLDEAKGSKVPTGAVQAAIDAHPEGLTWAELGALVGVKDDTAHKYANALGDAVVAHQGHQQPARKGIAPQGDRSETDPAPIAPNGSEGTAIGAKGVAARRPPHRRTPCRRRSVRATPP